MSGSSLREFLHPSILARRRRRGHRIEPRLGGLQSSVSEHAWVWLVSADDAYSRSRPRHRSNLSSGRRQRRSLPAPARPTSTCATSSSAYRTISSCRTVAVRREIGAGVISPSPSLRSSTSAVATGTLRNTCYAFENDLPVVDEWRAPSVSIIPRAKLEYLSLGAHRTSR